MDVFLVGMAAKDELELRSGDYLADNVKDIVTHDPLGSGKVSNAHFDDPALDIRNLVGAPLLDVFLHRDVLWLPMIVLHCFVEIVGPLVFQREDVEEHRFLTVDDFFGIVSELGLRLIEDKSAST